MGAPRYKNGEHWQDRLKCGTPTKYVYGCRCDACREAHANYAYFNRTGRTRGEASPPRKTPPIYSERDDRFELYRIAADIENIAIRLEGKGRKSQAGIMFSIVRDLRIAASHIAVIPSLNCTPNAPPRSSPSRPS